MVRPSWTHSRRYGTARVRIDLVGSETTARSERYLQAAGETARGSSPRPSTYPGVSGGLSCRADLKAWTPLSMAQEQG